MVAVSGKAVAEAARGWLGVPFRHQGRTRAGVDCVGLVIGVARALELLPADFDHTGYARRPDGVSLLAACRLYLTPVSFSEIGAGDVVVFRVVTDPQHLAVVADYYAGGRSVVHAYALARGVVETRLDDDWQRRLVAAFRLPGVA